MSTTLLAGCHAYKPLAVPRATAQSARPTSLSGLKTGDYVRITLRDGNIAKGLVAEIQADALLASSGRRILFDDIGLIEVRRLSAVKTSFLVGFLVIAVFGIVVGSSGGIPTGTI